MKKRFRVALFNVQRETRISMFSQYLKLYLVAASNWKMCPNKRVARCGVLSCLAARARESRKENVIINFPFNKFLFFISLPSVAHSLLCKASRSRKLFLSLGVVAEAIMRWAIPLRAAKDEKLFSFQFLLIIFLSIIIKNERTRGRRTNDAAVLLALLTQLFNFAPQPPNYYFICK
jgi:hypothetical protein